MEHSRKLKCLGAAFAVMTLCNVAAPTAADIVATNFADDTLIGWAPFLQDGGLLYFTLHSVGERNARLLLPHSLTAVSSVPIPAAMWLLGSALVGLAAIGRRRRSSPMKRES